MLGPYSVPRSALFCTNQRIFKTERHTRTGIEPGLTAVALAFYLHWPALRSFSRPSEQHPCQQNHGYRRSKKSWNHAQTWNSGSRWSHVNKTVTGAILQGIREKSLDLAGEMRSADPRLHPTEL